MKYKKIVIFSGAGISAESGIKTFRDSDGLWENHKIEEVCDAFTWRNNYELVHKFYDDRREQLGTVVPNRAHELVSEWQKKYLCLNVTTNVDDMFERSGVVDTVHLHGYIPEVYCTECGMKYNLGYDRLITDGKLNHTVNTIKSHRHDCVWHKFSNEEKEDPYICKIYKPNVVFFNEAAPKYSIYYKILEQIDHETLVIVVGASNIVVDFIRDLEYKASQLVVIDPNEKILDNYPPIPGVIFHNTMATEGFEILNDYIKNNVKEKEH